MHFHIPSKLRPLFFEFLRRKGAKVHERRNDRLIEIGGGFALIEAVEGDVDCTHLIPELQALTAEFFKVVESTVDALVKERQPDVPK